jgi:hypothetical protein
LNENKNTIIKVYVVRLKQCLEQRSTNYGDELQAKNSVYIFKWLQKKEEEEEETMTTI